MLKINGKDRIFTETEKRGHAAMGPRYMAGLFSGEEMGATQERIKTLAFLEAKVAALDGPGEHLEMMRATLLDACRWLRGGKHAPYGKLGLS
ncbi:hypothetical protein LCGC14_0820530 [marine sediment metagenome]|uniref:Uncharacterized protein n=1 Tax=marine sediment metagenome TaxID=412755 RepID=A0A0F9PIZ5_9ZZZZ